MKKLIYIWAPSFSSFGGGIGRFSNLLLTSLSKNYRLKLFGKHDLSGVFKGKKLIGCKNSPNLFKTIHFSILLIASVFFKKPDLIIVSHLNFAPVAYLINIFFKVPYFICAYGIDVNKQLPILTIHSIKKASQVLTISKWTRDRLLLLGIDEQKIINVGLTASNKLFCIKEKKQKLIDKYNLHHKKIILSVTRLDSKEQYKGYDKVIKSLPAILEKIPNVHYLIVGSGDDIHRTKSIALKNNVLKYITFCGFVSENDLCDYYNISDLFVLPSKGEGFGIVFLEAMLCGTPVIAGNMDGSVDALADGDLGILIDPDNINEIASTIISVLNKAPKSNEHAKQIREKCIKQFNESKFSRKIKNILRHHI